jgi:hypothetical protein
MYEFVKKKNGGVLLQPEIPKSTLPDEPTALFGIRYKLHRPKYL